MKFKAYNIKYDFSGTKYKPLLPNRFVFEVDEGFNIEDEGADLITQQTGWCVNSFKYEEVE